VSANRKLQVFVSSTYTDMFDERQAAVQAILEAGHIPAGMELFASGNETQLKTIYRWMDDSDVHLLILGGRYGTIEPKSQKSYTELEFDYAVKVGKSLFSIVISEIALDKKLKLHGLSAIEARHSEKLNSFRNKVLSRSSGFYSDSKDIRIETLKSLNEKLSDDSLIGYIRADRISEPNLLAENMALKVKVADLTSEIDRSAGGPDFHQLPEMSDELEITISQCSNSGYSGETVSILGTWSDFFPFFCDGLSVQKNDWNDEWYFSVQEETSCTGFAHEILAALQGYAVPNTVLKRSDFDRLRAYYIEVGLMADGSGNEPINKIGRQLARRAKINWPDLVAGLRVTNGRLPLNDPREIPF